MSPLARHGFANLPESSDRRGAVDEMHRYVWVKPEVWCEVEFAEWTAGGRLRHAAVRQLLRPVTGRLA